ncbi:MAG: peroxiredoxin [Verrucomicrobiales bacterium]|nr:peroxiredoxin [Verrucomicrobiales bacterium]
MIVGAIGAFALATGTQAADLKSGDMAPDFTVKASDGKTYSLKQFKGKQAVVIAWFPKAFTPGCTAECDSFRTTGVEGYTFSMLGGRKFDVKSRKKGSGLDKYDVAFFTASCDTPETNARFAKELKLDYPILSDNSTKMAKAYGVIKGKRPYPARYTFIIGKDGKILEVDKQKNTAGHGAEVAKKLAKYGVPKK